MKKVLLLLLAAVFAAGGVAAQGKPAGEKKEKKPAATKEDKWDGWIVRTNKQESTLTVRSGNVEKAVVYDKSTKWTRGTAKVDPSEFKDGARVICLGKWDEKGRLIATRIDLRVPK
jgi:Ni/Co efflux regulator RcnB